jgi:hypothetical protein
LAQQYEQALVWTVWRVGGVTGTGTTLIWIWRTKEGDINIRIDDTSGNHGWSQWGLWCLGHLGCCCRGWGVICDVTKGVWHDGIGRSWGRR